MSHFYGVVRGGRGEATRGGTKASGLIVHAASWQGCVEVELYCEVKDGREVDHAVVKLKQWEGQGAWPSVTLYDGPVSGEGYSNKVEIQVWRGLAEVVSIPPGIEVEIDDQDVEGYEEGLDVTEAAP